MSVFGQYSWFRNNDDYAEFREEGAKDSFDAAMTEVLEDESTGAAQALFATFVSVPDGIADGEVPTWDAATQSWVAGTGGGGAGFTDNGDGTITIG